MPKRRPAGEFQFTMLALFAGLTMSCFLAALLANFGAGWCLIMAGLMLATLILLTPVALVWGLFYWLFPQPTKYATVFGLVGFMLLAPLPGYLLRSRDAARHASINSNLRHFGHQVHQFDSVYPHIHGEIITGRDRYESLIKWTNAERIAQDEYLDFPSANGHLHEPQFRLGAGL